MSKSCSLKGRQKVFFLQFDQAASCCRADPISLQDKTIEQCVDLWQQEHDLLDQGHEIEGCRHCWQAEHNEQISYRQQHGNKSNYNYVEIFLSNLCNQMCSYCSPKFSSEWDNSIRSAGNFTNVSKSAIKNLEPVSIYKDHSGRLTELKNILNKEPVSLKLLGGEPLMQQRNLQQLLEFNSGQITELSIHTNLNPPSNKFLQWILDEFPTDKLKFVVSLDTIPTYNAIPRAGFDQTKFEQNLDLLEKYNVSFLFFSVISVLNIFSISQYQSWLLQKGYESQFAMLNNPDCLDPKYLPDGFKTKVYSESLPDVVRQSLNQKPNLVDLKLFEQYNYLKQYFSRTNTVLTDPGLAEYWSWLKSKYK